MKCTSRIALGAAFAALLATATPALADLKIGLAAEPYPPFASQDATGKWVGWEVDFAEALCAEVKEKCEIVATGRNHPCTHLEADRRDRRLHAGHREAQGSDRLLAVLL